MVWSSILSLKGPPPQQVVACSPCRHLWPLPGSTRCDLRRSRLESARSSEVPGLAPVIKIISIPYPYQNGKILMVCGDINGIYIYIYILYICIVAIIWWHAPFSDTPKNLMETDCHFPKLILFCPTAPRLCFQRHWETPRPYPVPEPCRGTEWKWMELGHTQLIQLLPSGKLT